jgi:hypothetical protein
MRKEKQMASELLKAKMESGLEYYRNVVLATDDTPFCHAIITDREGKLTMMAIDSGFMRSVQSKMQLCCMLLKQLFDLGGPMVFLSDGFKSNLPPHLDEKDFPPNLSDWPKEYVIDSIVCTANAVGEIGISCTQDYTRDSTGKAVFKPILFHDQTDNLKYSNRFVWDLTARDLKTAIAQVIAYGNGRHYREHVN